jgi:CHAT domain-containing protein
MAIMGIGPSGLFQGLFRLLAVSAICVATGFFVAPAFATQCDPLPTQFQPVRAALDELHTEVLSFLDAHGASPGLVQSSPAPEGEAAAQGRRLLEDYIDAVTRARKRAEDENYAIRLYDLIRLLSLLREHERLDVSELTKRVTSILAKGSSSQAIDLDVSANISQFSDAATRERLLARHLAEFGVDDRQWSIFGELPRVADPYLHRETDYDAKPRVEWALSSNNRRMQIEAIAEHASARIYTDQNIFNESPQVAIALEEVRTILDDVEARALEDLEELVPFYEGQVADEPCMRVSRFTTAVVLDTIVAAGTPEEKQRVLKFAVLHSLDQFMFQTEVVGAYAYSVRLLRLRLMEPELYRQALGYVESSCTDKEMPKFACAEEIMSSIFLSLQLPMLALELQRSSYEHTKSEMPGSVSATIAARRLASLQWRYGSATAASQLLQEGHPDDELPADSLGTDLRDLWDTHIGVADANLDDREVETWLRRMLEARSRGILEHGNGTVTLDPSPYVIRYLRRQICSTCEGRLDPLIAEWLPQEMRYAESPEGLIALRIVGDEIVSGDRKEQLAMVYLSSVASDMGGTGENIVSAVSSLRGRPVTALEAATILALAEYHPHSEDNGWAFIEAFMRFMFEPKLEQKRELYDATLEQYYSIMLEFGGDADYAMIVARLADYSRVLGYGLAARVFDEQSLSLYEGQFQARETEQANLQIRVETADLSVPLFARLARQAVADEDAQTAREYMSRADDIVREALGDTWRADDEQSVLRFRRLESALRLIAQLRVTMAVDGRAEDTESAFESLQYAMLGETALTARSATRRKLLVDDKAREAIDAKLRAEQDLRLFEYNRDIVGVADPGWERSRLTILQAAVDRASSDVDAILPTQTFDLDLSPSTVSDVQSRLASGQAVVVLHQGSDAIYGVFVTSGIAQAWRSEVSAAALEDRVASLRLAIDGPQHEAVPSFPFADAHSLLVDIFGPVQARLSGLSELMIVADGSFLALPFAALPLEMPTELPTSFEDFRTNGIRWMGKEVALRFLPTVNAITAPRPAIAAGLPFAGVGDPVLFAEEPQLSPALPEGLVDPSVLRTLAPLPETKTEILSMAQLLNARREDVLIGEAATEHALRSLNLADYRVIALATHGLLAGELQTLAEPGLVLTPPEVPTVEDDGYLALSEVMSLDLNAELVLLSACNTAGSDGRPRASGLTGLARGFLAAGAQSIAVTHWSVSSSATLQLTTDWFQSHALAPDKGWASALKTAMAEMIETSGSAENAHPRNWAALMIFGRG